MVECPKMSPKLVPEPPLSYYYNMDHPIDLIEDQIELIENPVLGVCIQRKEFMELYGTIYNRNFFEINPINNMELRFQTNKHRNLFYKISQKNKLGYSFSGSYDK